jgi:excisionase family DNA binding protein
MVILCNDPEERFNRDSYLTKPSDFTHIPLINPQPAHRAISPQDLPLVLSVEELTEVLNIGRNTAYALVRSGQIRSVRVGKTYRIPRDAVEEFLKK